MQIFDLRVVCVSNFKKAISITPLLLWFLLPKRILCRKIKKQMYLYTQNERKTNKKRIKIERQRLQNAVLLYFYFLLFLLVFGFWDRCSTRLTEFISLQISCYLTTNFLLCTSFKFCCSVLFSLLL